MPRRSVPAALAAVLVLAACQPQSPRLAGVEPAVVEVEGWRIAVYEGADEIQAIRLNPVWGASSARMLAYGQEAARRATGCALHVRSAAVNPSVLTARKDCP